MKIRCIEVGKYSTVQGILVRTLINGEAVVHCGRKEHTGKLITSHRPS